MNKKREAFLRLAQGRVNKVLDALRILENCSNKASYEYGETDVEQMFLMIDEELAYVKSRFTETPRIAKSFVFEGVEAFTMSEEDEEVTENTEAVEGE